MAGEMTTRTFFQSQTKVVKRVFLKTAAKVPVLYPQVFNIETPDMRRSFWTVLPIVGLGTFALKPEGAAPTFDQAFEGTPSTFNFATYSLGYRVTEEGELEDAQNVLARLPRALAYSEQVTKELIIWNLANLAFSGSVLGFDGVALASTAHPLQGVPGVTVSNSGGTTALTPEALQNAFVAFHTLVDDRNLPIYRSPKVLMVGPQLHKVAEEVTGSPYYPYSNENKINVVEGKVRPLVVRYITSATQWAVLAAKGDIEADSHSLIVAFKWQNRDHSWVDDSTGNFNHKSSFRMTMGWIDWRGTYWSQGS